MKQELLQVYLCPISQSRLMFSDSDSAGSPDVTEAELVCEEGHRFKVKDGIPIFVRDDMLTKNEQETQTEYDASAEEKYDAAVDWLFRSFCENEDNVRELMINLLELTPAARVLEIGAGTGRDSFRIARRLGPRGEFFVQDLSDQMVLKTRDRLESEKANFELKQINYFVSTARFLPFPNGFFDAVFHFGGFNNFSQPKETLKEMTRIVKQNGRVVFGDESLPPWLEGTEFGEIIVTNNPLFRHKAPLDCIPENARAVTLRWILGGCFYLFDFKVGAGPPQIDLDLPHKGWRGGTMRTRYYGRLEGVTPEARDLAIAAAKAKGLSVHEWLDSVVKNSAKLDLDARAADQEKTRK